ncbi:hypothetical protein A3A49_02790 [Candidatus Curtissbacteria bacterium RIFCSPLOWO2_01_FULL_38_11b]|uniref:6-phosphogluconate dehydrogenase C-terminal domain-containing protein n=1 Tax=Candidatus Curtissbacteria bacterium RIFCSPLOWO2_01_FULL_38_11b TaxID=1797725 RepID=A0A1F5H1A4_9BACT|nr:MAG: hypothetical protein A3A49_02790 [Candidatus Curtissbacteria bacterium RIFCSPLOWO2_01_FULL_38_11b]
MKLGFIGVGRMGSRMVTKLVKEGHEVVVWNRTRENIENLKFEIRNLKLKGELEVGENIADLLSKLDKPRIVWLMLPARSTRSVNSVQASSGSKTVGATQEILDEVEKYIDVGDIVIDGGNAHYTDTQKRFEHFSQNGIRFLGIGVSGGIIAARSGYPLMVGGNRSAYKHIKPILDSLARPSGGFDYFGEGGAGHFVKMVHNGIEYGLMQSIGEGFGILSKSPYNLDLVRVAKLYQKGTLVSGFMMARTVEALNADPKLEKLDGYIEASGEGDWTVQEARVQRVPLRVIEEALNFRTKSRKDVKISASFAARLVSALRQAFGGHEVKVILQKPQLRNFSKSVHN